MARKPNYAFERNNRAKAKAAKREAKLQAKLAARAQKSAATSTDASTVEADATNGNDDNQDNGDVAPGSS